MSKLKIITSEEKKKKSLISDQDVFKKKIIKYEEERLSNKPFSNTRNDILSMKEDIERKHVNDETNDIYPHLYDPNFNVKIFEKKEFNSLQQKKEDIKSIDDFEEHVEQINKKPFEITPNQQFIKNFMSQDTPYNSLLLYHGLGTGKTCTSIGVAEEVRQYMVQMGIKKKIIIVASPNVQDNFKLQLFDERKLEKKNNIWNLKGCTGMHILKEVNPMNTPNISKEKIVSAVNNIISSSYLFVGYRQFANYILKIDDKYQHIVDIKKRDAIIKRKKQEEFQHQLIIIDEVHNIRTSRDIEDSKNISSVLVSLIKVVKNIHLLLLSATPMYNDYKEIIWLLNLLNINDNRSTIKIKDIFDEKGKFIKKDGEEIGKIKFIEKAQGYISFVQGENPFTFPYRVYPEMFDNKNSFKTIKKPTKQIEGSKINEENMLKHLDIYPIKCGTYQKKGYDIILKMSLDDHMSKLDLSGKSDEKSDSFTYSVLQDPIKALNIIYPSKKIEDIQYNERGHINITKTNIDFIGDNGLKRFMNYEQSEKPYKRYNFNYIDNNDVKKYGRIFSPKKIGLYSSKIKNICEKVNKYDGISIIYSQYISSGVLPMALALEEIGFKRHGEVPSLLHADYIRENNIEEVDAITNLKKSDFKKKHPKKNFNKSSYVIISGDIYYSPQNNMDINNCTAINNVNGENVKVILITRAGSEGIDLKFVRNVFIMDPWYNLNRIDQIIGRAVRNKSHIELPLEKRNVQIFLYSILFDDNENESVDNFMYRNAEKKSIVMGKITRTMKEISADCLLNVNQHDFTDLDSLRLSIITSSGKKINYPLGLIPNTSICDYMDNCEYKCASIDNNIIKPITLKSDIDVNLSTYNENFVEKNYFQLLERIKTLFKEKYFYTNKELMFLLSSTSSRNYTKEEISTTLNHVLSDGNFLVNDMFKRSGNIINIGKYYFFQPTEMKNEKLTLFERSQPVDFKHTKLKLLLNNDEKFDDKLDDNTEEKYDYDTEEVKSTTTTNDMIYKKIMDKYSILMNTNDTMKTNVKQRNVVYVLKQIYSDIQPLLSSLIITFLIDRIDNIDKIKLYFYITALNEKDDIQQIIYEYLNDFIIEKNTLERFVCINEKNEIELYDIEDKNIKLGGQGDIDFFNEVLQNTFFKSNKKYATFIGSVFYSKLSKAGNYVLNLKIKSTEQKRTTSRKCSDIMKKDKLTIITRHLNVDDSTKIVENTFYGRNDDLCIFIEMIFRYYSMINKNNLVWFLNPVCGVIQNKNDKEFNLFK